MNKIKFLKKEEIELNGVRDKPYKICSIPTTLVVSLMSMTQRDFQLEKESVSGSITKDTLT